MSLVLKLTIQPGLLKAIRYFGSQKALAKALGVKQQAVSDWLNRQCHIPYNHVLKIACLKKGKVTPLELAPDDPLSTSIFQFFEIIQSNSISKEITICNDQLNAESHTSSNTKKHSSKFQIEFEKIFERRNVLRQVSKKLKIENYVKICASFWNEIINKKMKPFRSTLIIVSLYVQTCRHANVLGLYYLPLSYIAYDTGIDEKKVRAAMKYLQETHFCSYDFNHEYIWIHEMAMEQVGEKLDADSDLIDVINHFYHSIPALSFLKDFFEIYGERFLLKPRD